MAYETPILDTTLIAAADLSSSQFCAVVTNSTGLAALPAGMANVTGFIQNKPTSGLAVAIRVEGITKAVVASGSTVTPGNLVKVNASGQVLACTTGETFVGICIATANVVGVSTAALKTTILLKSGVALSAST